MIPTVSVAQDSTDQPTINQAAAAPPVAATSEEEEPRLRFSFKYAPWKDVLDWLAEESGSALTLESPPPGTFNYTDPRSYTVPEAIDRINSLLLTKGYTLVRRDKMILLVNLEDGVPPNLVTQVTPEQLDSLGEYELVSCMFPLERMNPEQASEDLEPLLGPQGEMLILPTSRQVVITETAGKLRRIRKVIQRVENPTEEAGTKITPIKLEHISPDEALLTIRQLMDIADGEFANEAGTLRLSADSTGTRLLVKASPKDVAEIRDILKIVDVPLPYSSEMTIAESPQLEVYSVGADPETTLQVLQTLLAGMPDVRLQLDPLTNNVVALARPAEHATIRATLDQLESEYDKIEIFDLKVVDPTTARLAVESMFGIGNTSGDDPPDPNVPRVDANLTTRQLLVRGRPVDIDRIRLLLDKMGEGDDSLATGGGNIRLLPITSGGTSELLQRAEAIWPTIRGNRIRTVTPSDAVDTLLKYNESKELGTEMSPRPSALFPSRPGPKRREEKSRPTTETPPQPKSGPAGPTGPTRTGIGRKLPGRAYLLAQVSDREIEATFLEQRGGQMAEIIVAPGPGGLLIASDDTEALDEFERLLEALSDPTLFQSNEYTVYYLRYAKAEPTAEQLNTLINGSGGGGGGDEGGGLGGLAEMALGGGMGSLFSSAADAFSFGDSIQIVPDSRLNALFVKGPAADVEKIRQLLEVIDQAFSPEEVETTPVPRLIPVFNANAADIADVVSQIYVKQQAQEQNQKQPNVQELFQAMRRGRGGGQNSSSGSASSEPEVTVGVDQRSNSIVVSAPDPIFEAIESLVQQLDDAAIDANETTRVVTLKRANAETIQSALVSLFGGQVQGNNNGQQANGNNPPNAKTPNNNNDAQRAAQERMRRQMEFFNAIRQQRERASGGGRGGQGGRDGRQGGRPGGRPGGRQGGRPRQ